MNLLFPIAGAVLQAGSYILDKVVLSMRRVNFKTYTGVSFPLIFLITLVIFFMFRPPLSFALVWANIWLLLLGSIGTIIVNLVFYRALDEDALGEIQTIDLLHNIPIIIFSTVFFADERNLNVIIPALVASCAVIWSHWEQHRFRMKKNTLLFLAWSVGIAPIGVFVVKTLLRTWSPISLQLVRSGFVALVLSAFFARDIKKTSHRVLAMLIATNALTSVGWIMLFFSYQRYGIVYTVLIFSLQPILVYLASVFLLKERIQWKKVFAFAVVLVSITAAQIIRPTA